MDYEFTIENCLDGTTSISNEHQQLSRFSECSKNIIYFFSKLNIALKIFWIICCVLIIMVDSESPINFWLIIIIFYSLTAIYCGINCEINDSCNFKINIYRIIYIIKIFTYWILFFATIYYIFAVDLGMIELVFFCVFFFVEYLSLLFIFLFFALIICCCMRRFFPLILTVSDSQLKIPIIGAAEDDLQKLNYCLYKNGKIVCLKNMPVIDENHENTTSCIICQDDYKEEDDIIIMQCQHHYHKICGITWLKINNSCPNCRKPL